jgi:beta-lactamase superfamily II metal-dependent hydrolase
MKKALKIISILMVLAMLVSSMSMFVFADGEEPVDENVILVGKNGKYGTISEAIAGETADGLDGKTLKLISDVSVSSTKFESKKATAPTIVVDGNGYNVSMSTGFVCIGVNITFKNMTANQTNIGHPFIYARGGAHVTVDNCETDDSFLYAFALNNAGDCHFTVNSGTYRAKGKVFNIDCYTNLEKAESTVTINGGTFIADGGNVACVSANTKLDINGGFFFAKTKAPMIVDTKYSLSDTANLAKIEISGATFVYSADGIGAFAENSAEELKANFTIADDVKLFAILDGVADGTTNVGSYASATKSFKTIENDKLVAIATTAPVINGAEGAFAKGYTEDGFTVLVNSAQTLELLDSSFFDGSLVIFSGPTDAVVDYKEADLVIDKNGFKADGITSENKAATIRSGLVGSDVYWQATGEELPEGDAKVYARVIATINNDDYKAAGLLYTTDVTKATADALVYNKKAEYAEGISSYKAEFYYESLKADGETVDAIALGGRHLLALDLGEFTQETVSDKIYFRVYTVDMDGNVDYSDIKCISVEDNYAGEGDLEGTYGLDDDHSMELYTKITKESFENKCAELVADGYVLYQQNDVNTNSFRTYYRESDKQMCHIYWVDHYKQMRVITATTDKLPVVSTNGNNDLCSAKLITMQGGDELGMVIRLNDGRFIVIDGGNSGVKNEDEIYGILKANAPDPENIVIATWYITHGHGDHHGAFSEFATKYSKDTTIKLESMMFNQLNDSKYISLGRTGDSALEHMKEYYPDVPVYKPLTGQKYTFSKTTIEILYTMSDFLPNKIVNEPDGKADGNTQTMPCIIDLVNDADYDDRLFVMGDMVEFACNEICARYGNLIECDVVQVSHHGLCVAPYTEHIPYRRRNSTKEIYTLINPKKAFWPGKEEEFARRMTGPVNIHLVEIIGEENLYKAWTGQHVFEFAAVTPDTP